MCTIPRCGELEAKPKAWEQRMESGRDPPTILTVRVGCRVGPRTIQPVIRSQHREFAGVS